MLIEPRKFKTWMPGEIRDGVYYDTPMKGRIDENGEYIPPELEAPIEMEEMEESDNTISADRGIPINRNTEDTPSVENAVQREKRDPLRFVFRVSAVSLSLVASLLSAWFSFGAIARNLPFPVALFLSAIVVFSSTLAPELIILLWRKKRFVMVFFVGFVGIVASAYSMTTTIAGQYNARESEDVNVDIGIDSRNERSRILAEIDRINISIDTYQTRITRATNDGKIDANATALKKQYEAKKAEYEKKLESNSGLLQSNSRLDFYTWVGEVTGINGDAVEFGASILPALLLDIAAPVFAVCFMVL